jgi:hypothetical protein
MDIPGSANRLCAPSRIDISQMFRHRKDVHRWAVRVLLLWLFGVGAGVANACLAPRLGEPGGHPSGQAAHAKASHRDAHASAIAHRHASHQVHHEVGTQEQQGSSGKSNCEDFCDKASASIPTLRSALDDAQVHAVPIPAAPVVVAISPFAPVQPWAPHRDRSRAPLIAIAFLRLTL